MPYRKKFNAQGANLYSLCIIILVVTLLKRGANMDKLEELIGQKLSRIGRAVDLCWFQFGNYRLETDHNGKQREVADYALDIQSSFRLWNPKNPKFRIGWSDIFNPCGGGERPDDFVWDIQGGNFYDEKVKALQEDSEQMAGMIVKRIEVNELFDLKITFTNGFLLETFSECFCFDVALWRLFEPFTEKPHLIVTGSGLEHYQPSKAPRSMDRKDN